MMQKAQKGLQKEPSFRSRGYLNWVKQQPCCLCGAPSDDPHHVIGLHISASGMGMQAPDHMAMPACRGCHNEIHRNPALHPLQIEWLRNTWSNALWYYGPSSDIGQRIIEARKYLRSQVGEMVQESAA